MHGGSVVDVTLISAPNTTKYQTGERDPKMHSTKKNNNWYFGMKIHAGVDADKQRLAKLSTSFRS